MQENERVIKEFYLFTRNIARLADLNPEYNKLNCMIEEILFSNPSPEVLAIYLRGLAQGIILTKPDKREKIEQCYSDFMKVYLASFQGVI